MNRDEIMKMTAEELQLEIARLKGWKLIYMNIENPRVWASLNSIGATRKTAIEALQVESEVLGLNTDWPTDTAAAWELESEIPEVDHGYYSQRLADVIELNHDVDLRWWDLIHATAEQRCRAWLMWKEEV